MPAGRPPASAEAIRSRLRAEGRTTLDLQADGLWLRDVTDHPHQLLADMARRRLAHRIQRGRYVVNAEDEQPSATPLLDALEPMAPLLLERLDAPHYLSWHTALFHYGLLEQHASTIFCAVPVRKRNAAFFGSRVRFVTLHRDRFFGIEPVADYGREVRMAAVEHALLDALERPELTAPFTVVLGAFADAARSGMLDPERLVRYAIAFGSPALARRVGLLMDGHGLEGSEDLHSHIGDARYTVPLCPGGSRDDGTLDVRWRVRVPGELHTTSEQPK